MHNTKKTKQKKIILSWIEALKKVRKFNPKNVISYIQKNKKKYNRKKAKRDFRRELK